MQAELDRERYENLWSHELVTEPHRKDWVKLKSIHRLYAQRGDRFIIWQLQDGQPTNLKALRVLSGGLDLHTGLRLQLEFCDSVTLTPVLLDITHYPAPLPDLDIFIWVPFFCNLRWTPRIYNNPKDERVVHLPFCIKTQSNYTKAPTEGHYYVTPLNKFRQEWPMYKNIFA